MSFTEVFAEAMLELCQKDSRVVGITAAMPDGTGLSSLAKDMPERFYDAGIAEQHAVTFAAGLACEKMVPVCAIYSTFLQRGFDQVLHDVCIQSLPVIFAMDRSGLVGADGPTHHGVFDISYLRCLPNLVCMAPKDDLELKAMLFASAEYREGPTAIRYPRGNAFLADPIEERSPIEIGKAEVIQEASGENKIALIGYGTMTKVLEAVSEKLEKDGIHCTLINARFCKPLDEELFEKVLSSHAICLTAEENALQGGFGSAVLEFAADKGLLTKTKLLRCGIEDTFIEHGTPEELHKICKLDAESIYEKLQREALS
ncbi:UNVERIFIED_CONTAM: hypothetical protein GTU68_021159 [Idotea baltica]|nr:hypothetical protein [Idotea baltica]